MYITVIVVAPIMMMTSPAAVLAWRAHKELMKTLLFACAHNAGRSQMAAALFNQLADPAPARAISAGTETAERVHSEVVSAMREVGVDLSGVKPQKLTEELASGASLLVTMGCGEQCPFVAGLEREDWPLPDPEGQNIDDVRRLRDEIRRRVQELVRRWSN
jgi:arsenate reductase